MYTSQCPNCAQHVYKLGHSLYTEGVYMLGYWLAWAHVYISKSFQFGHCNFYTSAVDSESIRSGNMLVQLTHPGPQPRLHEGDLAPPSYPSYLIMRGKTVVAKGLVFPSPHIAPDL